MRRSDAHAELSSRAWVRKSTIRLCGLTIRSAECRSIQAFSAHSRNQYHPKHCQKMGSESIVKTTRTVSRLDKLIEGQGLNYGTKPSRSCAYSPTCCDPAIASRCKAAKVQGKQQVFLGSFRQLRFGLAGSILAQVPPRRQSRVMPDTGKRSGGKYVSRPLSSASALVHLKRRRFFAISCQIRHISSNSTWEFDIVAHSRAANQGNSMTPSINSSGCRVYTGETRAGSCGTSSYRTTARAFSGKNSGP